MSHEARIEALLDGAARSLPPAELIGLFEGALSALWRRAEATLGEVTLTAIVDRVLYTATEKYPFLSALKLQENRARFDESDGRAELEQQAQLIESLRFVLVELLTVIGNLTDEILTPALHAELTKLGLDAPSRATNEAS